MREVEITLWVHDCTDEDCPECCGEMNWPCCKECDYTDIETQEEFGKRIEQEKILDLLNRMEICGGVRLEAVGNPNTGEEFYRRQPSK